MKDDKLNQIGVIVITLIVIFIFIIGMGKINA
jgi:hypothetical protein